MKPRRCLCGYPDWPGQCPGPENCPVHGEDLSVEKDERDPDAERERRRDDRAFDDR